MSPGEVKSTVDLHQVLEFLHGEVRPRAQEIDQSPDALRDVLSAMCQHGWMALQGPNRSLAPDDFRIFQEEVARVSGTLAFLQTQHQSAVKMIASSAKPDFVQAIVPHMADGTRLVGIGFSQLRRSGPPVMTATPTEGGYLLSGHVPWVTGYSFYPEFLVGATLPDGSALFGLVPLKEGPGVKVSSPMKLAAMEAAQSVTVDLDGYEMPIEDVAFIKPPGWIQNNDQINIALQGQFAVGNTLASLDVLEELGAKKPLPFICEAADSLRAELETLREGLKQSQSDRSEASTETRLQLRASVIELMGRAAHAAVTASSGAGNSLQHPAQRIYRESIVFTVSAQTTDIMRATLNRLKSHSF